MVGLAGLAGMIMAGSVSEDEDGMRSAREPICLIFFFGGSLEIVFQVLNWLSMSSM